MEVTCASHFVQLYLDNISLAQVTCTTLHGENVTPASRLQTLYGENLSHLRKSLVELYLENMSLAQVTCTSLPREHVTRASNLYNYTWRTCAPLAQVTCTTLQVTHTSTVELGHSRKLLLLLLL